MTDAGKYLLPTERVEVKIRRHWAVLAGDTLQTILLLVVGVLLARVLSSVGFAEMVAVYFCLSDVARWIWKLVDWNHEVLIVTDKRLLLLTGIFSRNVAIMPLVKVTDLTFYRSSTGLLLGYGKFIVESAGQDQALSTIDFVPQPEQLYIQISNLLFGGDKGTPGALVTQAQREAEQEAERAARGRWRRFTRRRTDDPVQERTGSGGAPTQLDAILADRDTLLADRDDPDRWAEDEGWDRPRSRDRDDQGWDSGRGDSGRGDDPRWDDPRWDDPRRRASGPAGEPRIHEPRRGDGGRSEIIQPDGPLPPPRRPRDEPPPGPDPADD
ncbi:MAG TPA: PH domain-containing protein [Mycobacteriales bacterium]|nr:PH domain-containing protein [Mycobacteriales bacterium]